MIEALFNAVKLADELCCDFQSVKGFASNPYIANRNYAVSWMKQCVEQVLGEDCPGTRDTAIQVFDRFLLQCYNEEEKILRDVQFLSYSAASSVIIAAKLHDTRSRITVSKFTNFDPERLMMFERRVLAKTALRVSPLCTPTIFLHHLISLCPNQSDNVVLLQRANYLIAQFWEDASSMLYAPSTIAISALLISFSLQKTPCTAWLDAIPPFCFMSETNPLFDCNRGFILPCSPPVSPTMGLPPQSPSPVPVAERARYLDTKGCITHFEQIPFLRTFHSKRNAAARSNTHPMNCGCAASGRGGTVGAECPQKARAAAAAAAAAAAETLSPSGVDDVV